MTDDSDTPPLRCPSDPCPSYRAGHNVHFIQARKVGQSPWGWRDAVVTGINEIEIGLAYVTQDAEPVLWHHRSLAEHISIGAPVRLHEQYFVLGTPTGWFSVVVRDGLGPVPEPPEISLWATEVTPGIVDLATGIALPTDHHGDT